MLQPISQITVFGIVRIGAHGGKDHFQVFFRDTGAKAEFLLVLAHGKYPTY